MLKALKKTSSMYRAATESRWLMRSTVRYACEYILELHSEFSRS